MIKKKFKWSCLVLLAVLLAAGFMLWSCHKLIIPGPQAERSRIESLARRTIRFQGQKNYRISYLRAGDPEGPRIIFIHGTPGGATAWADYLTEPRPGWESIAYDRPGFGQTRPLTPLASLDEQARAAALFLEERRGQWPILVGHSLGGPIAAQVAADHPDRVGALVIISGSMDPNLEEIKWYQKLASWWIVPDLLPKILDNSNRELRPLKQELSRQEALLSKITCPVIILHGTADRLVPVANVRYLKDHLTSAPVETIVIEGQDHFVPWNNRPLVISAINRAITDSKTRDT